MNELLVSIKRIFNIICNWQFFQSFWRGLKIYYVVTTDVFRMETMNIPETSLNQLALCKPVSSQFHSSSELVRQMEPTPSHNPHINNAMYFSSSSSSLSPLEPSPYSDLPVEIPPTSYGVSPSIQSPQKPLNVVPSADNTSYSAAQPFQNHWTPYSVTPSFSS